jgi:hypothetical protein
MNHKLFIDLQNPEHSVNNRKQDSEDQKSRPLKIFNSSDARLSDMPPNKFLSKTLRAKSLGKIVFVGDNLQILSFADFPNHFFSLA